MQAISAGLQAEHPQTNQMNTQHLFFAADRTMRSLTRDQQTNSPRSVLASSCIWISWRSSGGRRIRPPSAEDLNPCQVGALISRAAALHINKRQQHRGHMSCSQEKNSASAGFAGPRSPYAGELRANIVSCCMERPLSIVSAPDHGRLLEGIYYSVEQVDLLSSLAAASFATTLPAVLLRSSRPSGCDREEFFCIYVLNLRLPSARR